MAGSNLTVVNVGYRSTNYWVISAGRSRILVDLGWPGMFGALAANLDRADIPLQELKYGFATHFHIDHAGAAQELKRVGVPLLVTTEQVPFIPLLKEATKPADGFLDITTHDNRVITISESRALLAGLGIAGELIHTPGHSDDSVSLLLDDGRVFTGDLTHPNFIGPENASVVHRSWRILRDRGAKTVHAGHGPVRPMPDLPASDA